MRLSPDWKRRSLVSCLWLLGAVACGLALLVTARPALACSPDRCKHSAATLPAEGQALPANLRGIVWREPERRDLRTLTPLQLHSVSSDGVMTELTFERHPTAGHAFLRVVEALPPGTELVVTFEQEACGSRPDEQRSIRLNVTDSRPQPESLGHLKAESAAGWLSVPGTMGLCAQEVRASYVDLTLELADDAEVVADSLRYELRVDDEEAPAVFYPDVTHDYAMERIGESSLGRGRDRLYTTCPRNPALEASGSDARYRPSRALAPGPHRVRMVGLLPDGTELTTSEREIDLRCPEDEAAFARDAGVSGDAGPEGRRSDGRHDADEHASKPDGGCSVFGVGYGSTPRGEWGCLAACAALLLRAFGTRSKSRSHGRAACRPRS